MLFPLGMRKMLFVEALLSELGRPPGANPPPSPPPNPPPGWPIPREVTDKLADLKKEEYDTKSFLWVL